MKHTPSTAARAIRAGYETGTLGRIAKTWPDYFAASAAKTSNTWNEWADAYHVNRLVFEQCGYTVNTPLVYWDCVRSAVEQTFPELFADYWENLPRPSVNSAPSAVKI